MPTDDRDYSPFEYLRDHHGPEPATSARRRPPSLETLKKHLAWDSVRPWAHDPLHSPEPFAVLDVPGCLYTMRVPVEALERVFERVPKALATPWGLEPAHVLSLCLALMPPFHTVAAGHMRNVSFYARDKYAWAKESTKIKNYRRLLEGIAQHLLDFDADMRVVIEVAAFRSVTARPRLPVNRMLSDSTRSAMRRYVDDDQVTLVLERTTAGGLPAPLRGRLDALMPPEARHDHRWPRRTADVCFDIVLEQLWQTFQRYGPEPPSTARAMYVVLSEVLSNLLRLPTDLLDPRCTTRGAIQKRLTSPKYR